MKRTANFLLVVLIGIAAFYSCTNSTISNVYDVTDYGARGDSSTMNTEAIQKAINEAEANGGGKVVVPPGVYYTGTLMLKDNITFKISHGAKLLGSPKHEDYKSVRRPMYRYHKEDPKLSMEHLILVKNCENVTICGGGTIHGNGKKFWKPYDTVPAWIHPKPDRVSNMVEVQYSENVKIKDVFLTMTPEWTLHVFDSKNIEINGITIDNGYYGPNNDGIDITGCEDVKIANCDITTCDDAICFKAAVDGGPCERGVVTNCVIKTNCVALKIGSNLTFQPIKNITFSNCVIERSSRGVGLYSTKGARFENINVSNIVCNTNAPLVMNRPIHLSCWNKEMHEWEPPQNSELKNITISNFTAITEGRILMAAQEGTKIENVTLRDIKMVYPFIEDPAAIAPGHGSSQGSPKNPVARGARAAIVAENMENLVIDGVTIEWPEDTIPEEWKVPVRIENGTSRRFKYDYSSPRQSELSVFWGKNVQGGYIFAPDVQASSETQEKFVLKESSFKIRH